MRLSHQPGSSVRFGNKSRYSCSPPVGRPPPVGQRVTSTAALRNCIAHACSHNINSSASSKVPRFSLSLPLRFLRLLSSSTAAFLAFLLCPVPSRGRPRFASSSPCNARYNELKTWPCGNLVSLPACLAAFSSLRSLLPGQSFSKQHIFSFHFCKRL